MYYGTKEKNELRREDNDCAFCAPNNKAQLKITVTDMDGILLDSIKLCRPCFDKFGSQLELEIGDLK